MTGSSDFSRRTAARGAAATRAAAKCGTAIAGCVLLAACSSLGGAGPSGSDIRNIGSASYADSGIKIVDLDNPALVRIAAHRQADSFAETFGDGAPGESPVGIGDIVDVTIWEAPPAVLFGATGANAVLAANTNAGSGLAVAQSASIPQQSVGADGTIAVPFAGAIPVAGRSTGEIERLIVGRLRGKAHDPQAIVRLVRNEASNVTVIGAVANSRRVPLGAVGERVLDALAAAGGPREDVDKTTIQIARGGNAVVMPLEQVVRDPRQNIRLLARDVVTVFHQPFSFTALGAVNRNAEIPFEGGGITLAQALGRVGGLRDDRADIRGVFVFRMEQPAALDPAIAADARMTANGLIPVIYRLNLSDPASIFAARDFRIEDGDVLYISTAPGADLQRFISTLSGAAFSVIGLGNALDPAD